MLWGPDGRLYATDRDANAGDASLVIWDPVGVSWTTLLTTGLQGTGNRSIGATTGQVPSAVGAHSSPSGPFSKT